VMQQVAPTNSGCCNEIPQRKHATRVKCAQAARELGINRSSLKRYLDQYPELLDAERTVDLEELRRHRADNPRVVEAAEEAEAAESQEIRSLPSQSKGTGRSDAKARLDEARAQQAELDLAIRRGELVDPGDMLDAISEAGNFLRDKFTAVDFVLCEKLASETDPLVVKSILSDHNRSIVMQVRQMFANIAKPKSDEPA
jgi:hypothetical protein